MNPTNQAEFARIEEIIARIRDEWMQQPNVIDVVPALKTTGGKVLVSVPAIGFHVTEKVEPDLLSERGLVAIPPEIDGVLTDVIAARARALGNVDTKDTRSQMFDTLVGGIAVGNANINAYGTLGMTLLAVSDSRVVGITNEHVLVFDGNGQAGNEVQQPRFYLNSEVSLDSASCCPNGQLHYRGVDNPIVDAAVAVFTAAAIAAALSDDIDPHRRGQDATVPDPGERTLREVVSVKLDYPQIPFPGRPYELGVDWTYERHTDRRVMGHAVSETNRNRHVLLVQQLLTDRTRYGRGDTVSFLAILGPEAHADRCDGYFVTAAALSPSHNRAYKIILRPGALAEVDGAITHGSATHGVEGGAATRCHDFLQQKPGDRFTDPRDIEGLMYDPRGGTAEFVGSVPRGPIGLRLPPRGLSVRLRAPANRVRATLVVADGAEVALVAYSETTEVDADTSPGSGNELELSVTGPSIDQVIFRPLREGAELRQLCLEQPLGGGCIYRGDLHLAPDEELGHWQTYLFAQTRNDVASGIEPTAAAVIIGGLPVTDNFIDLGGSDHILYGHRCNVGIASDGVFEVIASEPVG